MMTNAIPVSDGRPPRSCAKASSPPADAPIPTIGKELAGVSGSDAGAGELSAAAAGRDPAASDPPVRALLFFNWTSEPVTVLESARCFPVPICQNK
jgi:hypothetical protein